MIAKTIKNSGSGSVENSVDYAQRQGAHKEKELELNPEHRSQVILMNNLSGSDAKTVAKEFKMVNSFNKNIEGNKKHIHEVISFSAKDLQKLETPEKRAEAVEKYLEHKGIKKENFQYIGVEHKDTNNIHVHVIHNRVGMDGQVYKASGNYERSAVAQERTEKEFGLDNGIERKVIYAPEEERGYIKNPNYGKNVGIVKTPKNRRINDNRDKERVLTDKQKRIIIQKEIKNALSKSDVSDINKFKNALSEKGISVEDRYNKEQKLTGVKFTYKDHPATGTQVGYKANLISSTLENNKLQEQKISAEKQTKIKPEQDREERFKKADERINLRVDEITKSNNKIDFGEDIDPILREEIAKEFPRENVWAVIDQHGGARYQDKLMDKVMDKAESMQKEKSQKIEPEKQHEKAVNDEYHRFTESKSNRNEKEQNQEQNQEKKRGFRRN